MTQPSKEVEALFQEEPETWIEALPEFQKATFNELSESGKDYDEIANIWLSASTQNTRPFGTNSNKLQPNSFIESLKLEIEKFICGDPSYDQERSKLFGENGIGKAYFISSLSIAISQKMAVAPMFLSPLIALLIAALGKITINSWCASRQRQRNQDKGENSP